jgi:hypothetical protein
VPFEGILLRFLGRHGAGTGFAIKGYFC